jgi:hypothetical protein
LRNKKLVIAVSAVLVAGACAFVAYRLGQPPDAQSVAAARRTGVENPEQSDAGMKTQPLPQLSDERFEPPPPISTGSYTDPKYREQAGNKTRTKVDDEAGSAAR